MNATPVIDRFEFERALWQNGATLVAGVMKPGVARSPDPWWPQP